MFPILQVLSNNNKEETKNPFLVLLYCLETAEAVNAWHILYLLPHSLPRSGALL